MEELRLIASRVSTPAAAADTAPAIAEYLDPAQKREAFIANARRYRTDLGEWLRQSNARIRGWQALQRYSKAHDELISAAYAWQSAQWEQGGKAIPRIAVLALGGYGRKSLFYGSDIDVMVLMEGDAAACEAFVGPLMHLLIDFRLDLGYSTRTVEECLACVGNDVESTTAMCESRLIIGNRGQYQRFEESLRTAVCGRNRRWFMRAVYQQWIERQKRFESSVFLLQPNLKDGVGGLRDVHTVTWLLYALTGATELRELKVSAGFEDEDIRLYREAIALLVRVRNELHIATGGKGDQLTFAHQPQLAERLGYEEMENRKRDEVFMGEYYRNARAVARFSRRAIRVLVRSETSILDELVGTLRKRRIDPHLTVKNKVLFIDSTSATYLRDDPDRIMELFERAMRWGYRISDQTLDHIGRVAAKLGENFTLNAMNSTRLMRILRGPWNTARTLESMHECGVLGLLLPEFARIDCMARIDHYHHYTVDAHTLLALQKAENFQRELIDSGKPGFIAKVASQIERWDLLNLALLLHDVGKGFGGGHALRGGQIAQRVCDRLGLSATETDVVRWLILSHLKLSQAAQRRDLSDPKVSQQLAEEIGSVERLRMLYVHTACDLMAVSPDTYNDWIHQLLRDCYIQTAAALGEQETFEKPQPTEHVREKILNELLELRRAERQPITLAVKTALREDIGAFLKHVGTDYLREATHAAMAAHYTMIRGLNEKDRILWELLPPPQKELSELAVCSYDETGLFSAICGALAAKGINIHSAKIFSTTDGFAINVFRVTDADRKPLPQDIRLDRLRTDLNKVLLGELEVEGLIEKHKVKRKPSPRARELRPPKVVIDNEGSSQFTIIEIRAADRPGLLYQITHAMNELKLDIERAIISTEAYGVVDVFYVTDLEYNKIHDESARNKIREKLMAAIEQA